jgi:hypothetical protein
MREQQAERLAEDRQAADDYTASVKDQVDRKVETERAVDGKFLASLQFHHLSAAGMLGLIILEARYGSTEHIHSSQSDSTIDVAIPLQLLVNGSQLSIPGGRSKVRSTQFPGS